MPLVWDLTQWHDVQRQKENQINTRGNQENSKGSPARLTITKDNVEVCSSKKSQLELYKTF